MKLTKLDKLLLYVNRNRGCTRRQVKEELGNTEFQYLNSYYGYVEGNKCRPEYFCKWKSNNNPYRYKLAPQGKKRLTEILSEAQRIFEMIIY